MGPWTMLGTSLPGMGPCKIPNGTQQLICRALRTPLKLPSANLFWGSIAHGAVSSPGSMRRCAALLAFKCRIMTGWERYLCCDGSLHHAWHKPARHERSLRRRQSPGQASFGWQLRTVTSCLCHFQGIAVPHQGHLCSSVVARLPARMLQCTTLGTCGLKLKTCYGPCSCMKQGT